MATFTSTIQLNDATRQDYENLFSKLEKHVLKQKCHLVKGKQFVDGKSEYKWIGNISIPEIAGAIFRSVAGMGGIYSFTIIRKKLIIDGVRKAIERKTYTLIVRNSNKNYLLWQEYPR